MGFKLEAPPLYPVIAATTMPDFGAEQAELLRSLPNTHALLALMRDGFHPPSPGGQVRLRADGAGDLDYPLNDFLFDAARRAFLATAEVQFGAGALRVLPGHEQARPFASWTEARKAILALEVRAHQTRLLCAHVMGGCAMSDRPERGVTRPDGRHWQVQNLSVLDGSLFPTRIGANPQLSIYGLVAKFATNLAKDLGGNDVRWG